MVIENKINLCMKTTKTQSTYFLVHFAGTSGSGSPPRFHQRPASVVEFVVEHVI